MTWPLGAVQRAVVVTTPVRRSIDCRQLLVRPLDERERHRTVGIGQRRPGWDVRPLLHAAGWLGVEAGELGLGGHRARRIALAGRGNSNSKHAVPSERGLVARTAVGSRQDECAGLVRGRSAGEVCARRRPRLRDRLAPDRHRLASDRERDDKSGGRADSNECPETAQPRQHRAPIRLGASSPLWQVHPRWLCGPRVSATLVCALLSHRSILAPALPLGGVGRAALGGSRSIDRRAAAAIQGLRTRMPLLSSLARGALLTPAQLDPRRNIASRRRAHLLVSLPPAPMRSPVIACAYLQTWRRAAAPIRLAGAVSFG